MVRGYIESVVVESCRVDCRYSKYQDEQRLGFGVWVVALRITEGSVNCENDIFCRIPLLNPESGWVVVIH